MKIKEYSFGKIRIDDCSYSSDLKIIKGNVIPNWWRESGHSLSLSDINDMINEKGIKIIVIGCGYNGMLKVPEAIKHSLLKKNIKLIDVSTSQAVKIFNETDYAEKTAFGLHLTC